MRVPSRLTIAIAVTAATIAVCALGIYAELAGPAPSSELQVAHLRHPGAHD